VVEWGRQRFSARGEEGRGVWRGRPGIGGRAQARVRPDGGGGWEGEEAGAGSTCKREKRGGNRGRGGLGR
jgi:hypothetical protein